MLTLTLLCLAISLASTSAWVLPGSEFYFYLFFFLGFLKLSFHPKSKATNTNLIFPFFSFILFFFLTSLALPVQYKDGSVVELKVNKITSLKHVLGYPHYSLGFCKVSTYTLLLFHILLFFFLLLSFIYCINILI